jgi:hypothetical protein
MENAYRSHEYGQPVPEKKVDTSVLTDKVRPLPSFPSLYEAR